MILLTGATGFVGRNLLLRLLQDGREVAASVRSPGKLAEQLRAEGMETLPSGLHVLPADPSQWPTLPVRHAVLGAGVLFGRSRDEYWSTNVDGTLAVLRRLPETCRTVLLSSLAAGGPTPPGKDRRESSDPDRPITLYGASKLAMEQEVRKEFPSRPVTILRPPMILGARDTATLPLFRMARGPLRLKPGFGTKFYSFLAVDDLVEGIIALLDREPVFGPLHPAAPDPISDWDLIATAAAVGGSGGLTLPVPEVGISLLSRVVDAVPALRRGAPSLTRDRVRDIWETRWVVDGEPFARAVGWTPATPLRPSLQAAWDFYRREGRL